MKLRGMIEHPTLGRCHIYSEDNIHFIAGQFEPEDDPTVYAMDEAMLQDWALLLNSPWSLDGIEIFIREDVSDKTLWRYEYMVRSYKGVVVTCIGYGITKEAAQQDELRLQQYIKETYNPMNEYLEDE